MKAVNDSGHYKRLSLVAILVMGFLAGCSKGSRSEPPPSQYSAAQSALVTQNNSRGNFTLVNSSGRTLLVSTDLNFDENSRIYRFSGASLRIDTRQLGGSRDLLRFYAITEEELDQVIEGEVDLVNVARQSPLFIASDGGSWNPFGALSGNESAQTGTLVVCNHESRIVGVTLNDPTAAIEGLVNRGDCNVSIKLPANGLMQIYFVDMETLEVIESREVGIARDTRAFVDIGSTPAVDSQATLLIYNNSHLHFSVINELTDLPLQNENCNGCTSLIAGSIGSYTLPANLSVELLLGASNQNLELHSDPLALARDTVTALVIERDDMGEITLAPFALDECYWSPYQDLCDAAGEPTWQYYY